MTKEEKYCSRFDDYKSKVGYNESKTKNYYKNSYPKSAYNNSKYNNYYSNYNKYSKNNTNQSKSKKPKEKTGWEVLWNIICWSFIAVAADFIIWIIIKIFV